MLNFNITTPIHKDNPRAITTCWSAFRKNLKNEIKLFDYAKIDNESTLEEKVAKFADAVSSAHNLASKPIKNTRHNYTPQHINYLITCKKQGFQRGRTTGAVFLDIQKAFDRVWIDGLIYKLITYNFPPAIIHILYSYLTNRKYKVRVNDTLSITHRVNIGVTQGSLLGPVLFNIYVNDIPSHPRTMINLYADDTAISATYKNTKSVTIALNKHLALLEKYFNDWKIKINVDKTVAVLFTKARKPIAPPTLYSTPLRWSQTTKYLGITFDKTLTWKPHILYARDKFRIALKKLYPLICRNSNMYLYNKVLLYTAVLRPMLSYGCPIWGYAANTNIKILETAQNSIIRCIPAPLRDDVTPPDKRFTPDDTPSITMLRRHTAKESTAPCEPQRTVKTPH
ncbi:probable RNA-directed DNA polymerase from transposon BS [Trichonephila clavipes]|nr:probable RNA-directed DNA polymerase from transposon BS [Trichonephila clavipes]